MTEEELLNALKETIEEGYQDYLKEMNHPDCRMGRLAFYRSLAMTFMGPSPNEEERIVNLYLLKHFAERMESLMAELKEKGNDCSENPQTAEEVHRLFKQAQVVLKGN